ncbi:MAG: hypothetical protein PHT58_00750 [Eubacteriales bacterium]|nr:hypothetical protein [Eubacteriales bacterium]
MKIAILFILLICLFSGCKATTDEQLIQADTASETEAPTQRDEAISSKALVEDEALFEQATIAAKSCISEPNVEGGIEYYFDSSCYSSNSFYYIYQGTKIFCQDWSISEDTYISLKMILDSFPENTQISLYQDEDVGRCLCISTIHKSLVFEGSYYQEDLVYTKGDMNESLSKGYEHLEGEWYTKIWTLV